MKRYTPEHARQIAQSFPSETFGEAWSLFGAAMRETIIDSLVMTAFRAADSADSEVRLSATEIVAFRELVKTALAEGAKRSIYNTRPRRFVVEP